MPQDLVATLQRSGARLAAPIPSASWPLPTRLGVTQIVLTALLAACTATGPATPSGVAATATPGPTAAATPTPTPIPSPTPAPTPAAVSELSPNDVLLAALRLADVKALMPATETWWPYFPEFNVGFSPYKNGFSDPSIRFFVAQTYERVGGPSERQIQSVLVLFDDAAAASRGLERLNQTNEADSTLAQGPAVGEESSYFTHHEIGYGGPASYADTAVLRFRVGPVVGRITVLGQGLEDGARLAGYAAPVVDRVGLLLQGRLQAEPLPAEFAQRMPPASDAVGSILGAVVAPAESWALVDTSMKPDVAAERLHSLGADSLGFGRASLAADPSQVIEATILPFRDAASATTWVKTFTSDVGATGLDPGDTGKQSAFTSNDGKFYELQFAAGRFVGDVSCFAPYGETSQACEGPVRQISEAWYAALSGS